MPDQNPRKRLEELEASIKERELIRTLELSRKNTTTTVILSILFPLGGYIYTKRWKALGISFSIFMGIAFMFILASGKDWDEKRENATTTFLGIIYSIVAPIDNAAAIKRAKEEIESIN